MEFWMSYYGENDEVKITGVWLVVIFQE